MHLQMSIPSTQCSTLFQLLNSYSTTLKNVYPTSLNSPLHHLLPFFGCHCFCFLRPSWGAPVLTDARHAPSRLLLPTTPYLLIVPSCFIPQLIPPHPVPLRLPLACPIPSCRTHSFPFTPRRAPPRRALPRRAAPHPAAWRPAARRKKDEEREVVVK